MRNLRSFLAGLYAFVSLTLFSSVLRSPGLLLHFPRQEGENATFLAIFGWLFYPGTAVLFGISALTYWRRWPTAKIWAMVVASLNVFIALIFVAGFWLTRTHLQISFGLSAMLLAVGLLGIAAFWKWDRAAEKAQEIRPKRIRGDGTSPILDKLLWVLAVAAYMVGMHWFERWANRAHLSSQGAIPWYVGLLFAELTMVLVHESGHALCGIAYGMQLRAFVVGPFQWRVIDGAWKFGFRPSQWLATGGSTAVVSSDPNQPLSSKVNMILAGPIASLAGGSVGLLLVMTAPEHPWERWWYTIAMFTTLSMVAFAANLIQFQTSSFYYSDGAQIYQILSGGAWADFHKTLRLAGATVVTPLRPRDFDIAAIHRAAAVIVSGPRAFLLRAIAHSYYQDCGRMEEASRELEKAQPIYDEFLSKIPAELLYALVTDAALQRRDATQARLWWDRAEAKKPKVFNGDYWMARSALAWIEGDMDEARSAWAKADGYLRGMPRTGMYDFDRDCLAALKKTIDTDPIARTPELADSLSG